MFWVKSEKAISVIFVFDLRKGGALIFTWKRSFWMWLQINTYLNYIARYDAMNKSLQEIHGQKSWANTSYSETYIKRTVAEVPKFIPLIFFKWHLY